jgi:small subunit ribosomal protein S20
MPNTKSAARRTRSNARKATQNRRVKNAIRGLEKEYLSLVADGKLEEAEKTLPKVASAYGRGAKVGAIKKEKASRKSSRLALHLKRAAKAAAAPKAPAKTPAKA